MYLTILWMLEGMILMKITTDGLEANWGEIKALADAYDRGCKSEESYKAKIMDLVYEMGYTQAMEDLEREQCQTAFLISHTMGNA